MDKYDKYVRVMCDYCADGVWNFDGASISNDELPISDSLKHRLNAWQGMYDGQHYDTGMPPDTLVQFCLEGLSIACEMKRQLPDWKIVLFNEDDMLIFQEDGRRNIIIDDRAMEVDAAFDVMRTIKMPKRKLPAIALPAFTPQFVDMSEIILLESQSNLKKIEVEINFSLTPDTDFVAQW